MSVITTFLTAISSGTDLTKITVPSTSVIMKLPWMSRCRCCRTVASACFTLTFWVRLMMRMMRILGCCMSLLLLWLVTRCISSGWSGLSSLFSVKPSSSLTNRKVTSFWQNKSVNSLPSQLPTSAQTTTKYSTTANPKYPSPATASRSPLNPKPS